MRTLISFAVASVAAIGAAAADPNRAADETAIRNVATAIDMAVDAKDWTTARSFFTDEIEVDFSSLSGVAPAGIPADALIDGWSANLGPAKTSYHQRGHGMVAIEGDSARFISNGYAWNRMEGGGEPPLWEVWGVYTHDLVRTEDGWKVSGMTLDVTHQRGNLWVRDTPAPTN